MKPNINELQAIQNMREKTKKTIRGERQSIVDQTPYKKLNILQHEPYLKQGDTVTHPSFYIWNKLGKYDTL